MTGWNTLIVCVTLVILAALALCAWLPYLKWGAELLKDTGTDGLDTFTRFVGAWPNPLAWVGSVGFGGGGHGGEVAQDDDLDDQDGSEDPEPADPDDQAA